MKKTKDGYLIDSKSFANYKFRVMVKTSEDSDETIHLYTTYNDRKTLKEHILNNVNPKYRDGLVFVHVATKRQDDKACELIDELFEDEKEDEYLDDEIYNLPQNIQDIIFSFDENKDKYKECARVVAELEPLGYTMDYGLDGELFALKKIK